MKLVKLLFVIILLLVLTNITLTNRLVDESLLISSLTKDIQAINNSNLILEAKIAELGSLPSLSAKISSAGFVVTPQTIALPTPVSVALR